MSEKETKADKVEWAKANRYVILTHDLDFGKLLALTYETGPSVIQVRTQDVMLENFGRSVVSTLQRYQAELVNDALIVIDEFGKRVRILPL